MDLATEEEDISPTNFSHLTPFVLVDSDCSEDENGNSITNSSLTLTYISSLLKFASQCYDAHIDFQALNLHEWQRVTKYNKHSEEETKKNTKFLHQLEQLIHDPSEEKITEAISSYFGKRIAVKVWKTRDNNFPDNFCHLYEKPDGKFQLILHRRVRYPDPDSRGQSLLEDLRDSGSFETYFRKLLEGEKEPFLIRKKYLEIHDKLVASQNLILNLI
ncbi:hypothetical protein Fcan01_18280 [Folsomia candida]|uniref:Uncharacterized protein n=1 Tax=Folsomia candida TaxID=158441 RepID=A0A226DQK2_FOLCA|nr:hypothetical protein Fcan01_18280 [Folsomia candida]